MKPKSYSPVTLLLFFVSLLIGGIGAVSSAALGAIVVIFGLVFAGVFLLSRPQKALKFSFFLIMLADTKFRMRDSHAMLSGQIDSQIIFELALYGIILLIILTNLRSIPLRRLKPTPMELVLFSYVALALTSSLWSRNFQITVVRGTQLLILYVFCFVAVRLLAPEGVLRILTISVVLYVLLFASMAVAFPWASGRHAVLHPDIPRFSWFSVHPIIAATYAATAAILIISEALFAQGAWRRRIMGLPLWSSIIPLLLILIVTRSRGPLIAFVVAVSALWVRRYVNPWAAGFGAYILLAISAVLLGSGFSFTEAIGASLGDGNSLAAFLLRGRAVEDFLSVSGRDALWQSVYALFLNRPLLGYGYISSRSLLLDLFPWAGHAHNALAETLLNLGLVGTALIWFALGRTLLSSLLQTSRTSGPVAWHRASILGVLVFLLFNSIVDTAFAGVPVYQTLLFFACVFGHNGLGREAQYLDSEVPT